MYLLAFSEFDTTEYSASTWVFFIMATIFIPLTMFNMIIAIMSDTYEKVT